MKLETLPLSGLDRRGWVLRGLTLTAATGTLVSAPWVHALGLTADDATAGVRTALERGASVAIDLLGRPDGFLGNPKVRIPLPGQLQDIGQLMRNLGQGRRVEELETAMNRAAEMAIPMGRDILMAAVRSMTIADARGILTGGDTSVTDFFAGRTRTPLTERFLPLVTQATERVELAQKYNAVAGRASRLGLVKPEQANMQQYVTGKALDGLYLVIGEEERKIRRDPVGTGSQILQRVFGALR
ncbi:MAG TPA: DUF4197 domain-containing protein [Hydrogenophaga sp.]|uniref:DUF4197 domain-containing protein n=1 Tax=Hydrogenophaga sp. TaxID=1904254 RepID=UPI002B64B315|nr:DUF4197 domain-containing protein [Hydrogenophaga sp.]HMN94539.1 DUF4197 domain-containing protein [Hydrogenophaga sp.]HMP11319.1 DUF4197 domain-containing protein [Hydrogenophaga sp.]